MKLRADQRCRDVIAMPGAERAAREAQLEIASAEVKAARALAMIEASRSYVCSGFSSVHAWAVGVGYGPQQIWRLLALGRTLLEAPELSGRVGAGRVPAESAVSVGKVILEPTLDLAPAEKAAWVGKAGRVPPSVLLDEAEKTVEEARQGEPAHPLRLLVTKDCRDGFRRARTLMSRGERRALSEGQTLARIVSDWLERNDPRLVPLPERRAGPTRGRRSRYIPRRAEAIVERRSGGMCEVCGVRRATQKIHIRMPHARGGSREPSNIADACGDCHVLVDAGVFVFRRFDKERRPVWRFSPGRLGASRVRERAATGYG